MEMFKMYHTHSCVFYIYPYVGYIRSMIVYCKIIFKSFGSELQYIL